VLFPQLNLSSDLGYLAQNLVQLGQDQRVCDLVRRYAVGYLMVAPDDYLTTPDAPGVRAELGWYAGVADPGPHPGFRLLMSTDRGQLRLYKITMCQPPSAAGQVEAASRAG
jgi:hypothetical protein